MDDTDLEPKEQKKSSTLTFFLKVIGGFYVSQVLFFFLTCVVGSCPGGWSLELLANFLLVPVLFAFISLSLPGFLPGFLSSSHAMLETKLVVVSLIVASVSLLVVGLMYRSSRWGFLLGVGAGWLWWYAGMNMGLFSA